MSHGEQWIVPLNLFLIAATVVLWGVALPLWTTLLIAAPLAGLLAFFGMDKYGGMQIVMLIAPAWLGGTMFLAKRYRDSVDSETALNVGYLAIQFGGIILVGAIAMFAMMAALVGLVIAWEWIRARLGLAPTARRGRNRTN